MLSRIFDLIKKPLDFLDDAYFAFQGIVQKSASKSVQSILQEIGAFIIGGVMFAVHFGEGYKSAYKTLKLAYDEELEEKRNKLKDKGIYHARLTKGALGTVFTGTGIGLSVTLIIGQLSTLGMIGAVSPITLALIPILPAVLPALLTAKYFIDFVYKAYKLYKTTDPEERKIAKRKLLFAAVELGTSMLITAAAFMAVFASFGIISTISTGMFISGAAVGSIAKIVEQCTKKQEQKKAVAESKPEAADAPVVSPSSSMSQFIVPGLGNVDSVSASPPQDEIKFSPPLFAPIDERVKEFADLNLDPKSPLGHSIL